MIIAQPLTTTPDVKNHLANVMAGTAKTRSETCRVHGQHESVLMPNGKWSPCPTCTQEESRQQDKTHQKTLSESAAAQRLKRLRESSLIPKRFQSRSLAGFEAGGHKGKEFAKAACQRYVERFDDRMEQGGGMVITGGVGAGKSHLAYAVGNALLAQGRSVMGIDVYELIDLIKERAFSQRGGSEREAIKAFVGGLELLILDEVGAQLGTEWERLMLFKIINERYKQMLPTILISNIDAAGLGEYLGERIIDRMTEGGGMTLTLDWDSYRRSA